MHRFFLIGLIFGTLFMWAACNANRNTSATHLQTPTRFELTVASTDSTYGFSETNPIKVGGNDVAEGPLNEQRFLNALGGPNGEYIEYKRVGSCCGYKYGEGLSSSGQLDLYEVRWVGHLEPITVYFTVYEYGDLSIPQGFTARKKVVLN